MEAADLSQKQLDSFAIVERACSIFSLLGCLFIIATFTTSKLFHKPINRLVFYASFGNMMTNVGTLMARTYVGEPEGPGCQFQAFLIQMFMPADAFWTLAMAVNVYLTFYYKFDAQRLRKMEVPYLICCYGVPFVVAISYIFVNTAQNGRMYGNAVLWCWVSARWDVWRIATFYGPVWVVILITFFIYIRAGREIYKKHKQLKNFSSFHEPEAPPVVDTPFPPSLKTTEVYVTSEMAAQPPIDLAVLGRRGGAEAASTPKHPNPAYSVTISSSKRPGANRDSSYGDMVLPIQSNAAASAPAPHVAPPIAPAPPPKSQAHRQRRKATYEANNAAWSYTKCAILFFTAMLITWIPSSANRVYSVVHGNEISLPLQYMSAFVLPLQGFWNALIYMVTSWKACQMFFGDFFHREPKPAPRSRRPAGRIPAGDNYNSMRSRTKSEKSYESESVTELAVSRQNSR